MSRAALLLYDNFLTFAEEVQLIWRRKPSGVTVIFLSVRYLTTISKILNIARGVIIGRVMVSILIRSSYDLDTSFHLS